MARPFRYQPPVPVGDLLRRERLVARLEERWSRRLVTVVAGPGFGKTCLLVDAMTSVSAPDRRDVWMSCEPGDESSEFLVRGLLVACGLRPNGTLEALCSWVWAQAPIDVCFVLDDVHELGDGSEGLSAVRQLLSDLPLNGHVVLASREPIAVPAARLATSGRLTRLTEEHLLFDDAELAAFASSRGVPEAMCASSGGWPALAELIASAGEELIFDYLWQEVLERIGSHRARQLALFHLVGGGDDAMASAITDGEFGVDELVAGVPLVAWTPGRAAVLHPLWGPALRKVVRTDDVTAARHRAAEVHLRTGRTALAIDLKIEAGAWDDALALLREIALTFAFSAGADGFARWVSALPARTRAAPEALLAEGLVQRARDPLMSCRSFASAARGFAARGDVDGEVAALAHEGIVRWWANDSVGLLTLLSRVEELAEAGSDAAVALRSIGRAAVAHVGADSAGVFAALRGVDRSIAPDWLPAVHWLRSVAYRREGDLSRAYEALDSAPDGPEQQLLQFDLARWRTDWLAGRIDHVCSRLAELAERYRATGDRYLYVETQSELAAREAWLGRADVAAQLLATTESEADSMPGAVLRILRQIAAAGIAVDGGRDEEASAVVRKEASSSLVNADRWYWRDRGAMALSHVLGPDLSSASTTDLPGAAHQPGLVLATALRSFRDGDSAALKTMPWPTAGIVRAHLPHRWVVELCAGGLAVGNRPPEELLERWGDEVRRAATSLASTASNQAGRAAARSVVEAMPAPPRHRVSIDVVGPLELCRDGLCVVHPDLRRQRVRELICTLVVRRRIRREQIASELWPDHPRPAHNLSVTLNYLQRLLQPERLGAQAPFFVRTTGDWLVLADTDHLAVDLWQMQNHLDAGELADRRGDPATALDHFVAALPLWRGEPLDDLPDTDWALAERATLHMRYGNAAVRAGELQLASAHEREAIQSANHALVADACNEAAYRVLIRARISAGDPTGARGALASCEATLATIGLSPGADTRRLLDAIVATNGPQGAFPSPVDRSSILR